MHPVDYFLRSILGLDYEGIGSALPADRLSESKSITLTEPRLVSVCRSGLTGGEAPIPLLLPEAERKTCRLLTFLHFCISSSSFAGIHCERHNCAGLLFCKNEH